MHKDISEIRCLTVNVVQLAMKLTSKAEKSLDIPKYPIILDVCQSEVITHFLRLRRKMSKSSPFTLAGSISGICLSFESLITIIKVQLGNMKLTLNDLDKVRLSSIVIVLPYPSLKTFDKTFTNLFEKYRSTNDPSDEKLNQDEEKI
jgi:hypothetical protein